MSHYNIFVMSHYDIFVRVHPGDGVFPSVGAVVSVRRTDSMLTAIEDFLEIQPGQNDIGHNYIGHNYTPQSKNSSRYSLVPSTHVCCNTSDAQAFTHRSVRMPMPVPVHICLIAWPRTNCLRTCRCLADSMLTAIEELLIHRYIDTWIHGCIGA